MDDPYGAPAARVDDALVVPADGTAVRESHLRREAALRCLGLLCVGFGIYRASLATKMVMALAANGIALTLPWLAVNLIFEGGPVALAFASAWGYLHLRPWMLVVAPFFWAFEAIQSPYVAPLAAYAGWLTLSRAGRTVLELDHAAVRAQTPHLRASSEPKEALVALGLFGVGVAATFALR